jgi:hypothetical protein
VTVEKEEFPEIVAAARARHDARRDAWLEPLIFHLATEAFLYGATLLNGG